MVNSQHILRMYVTMMINTNSGKKIETISVHIAATISMDIIKDSIVTVHVYKVILENTTHKNEAEAVSEAISRKML